MRTDLETVEGVPALDNTGEAELNVVVASRREVADNVIALELQHPSGGQLPAWAPGAHIDLELSGELTRQYSLCGDPQDHTRWRIAVLRAPEGRGGSAFVHDNLGVGDRVRVRGPRNHFALQPAPRYRFVAGGIGITPILPMLAAAEAAGAAWTLAYGGRTRASMAFVNELTAYGDRVSIRPQDECGLLDLDALLADSAADTLVYCCGPGPLLDGVEQRCFGWQPGALHIERFTPKDERDTAHHRSFEVELKASEMTLTVPPNRSILDVVEDAGVSVLSSCREGVCGTCETRVLAGEVDHRDSLLTGEEKKANDTMFICISRATSPKLVLDL